MERQVQAEQRSKLVTTDSRLDTSLSSSNPLLRCHYRDE